MKKFTIVFFSIGGPLRIYELGWAQILFQNLTVISHIVVTHKNRQIN